ncbi:hypothetical protein SLE2022_028010 [Rubroshorea leprosula]
MDQQESPLQKNRAGDTDTWKSQGGRYTSNSEATAGNYPQVPAAIANPVSTSVQCRTTVFVSAGTTVCFFEIQLL